MTARFVLAAAAMSAAMIVAACGSQDASPVVPTPPSSPGSVVISSSTPAPGATLTIAGTPPGAFIDRGSGQFGVTVSVTAAQDLAFAQLAVFLLTSDDTNAVS